MKKLILLSFVMLFLGTASQAQDKYFTRSGKISFYSSAPLEDIEAHNKSATSVIDTQTGKMEFAVLMKAFQFRKALMEQHFNENFVESHKYPKANFTGAITNLSDVDFTKDGTYTVNVKGNLTIHGVTKSIEAPGTISVKNGSLHGSSSFYVSPEEYNITIPSVVRNNIAKRVKVTVDMHYKPM